MYTAHRGIPPGGPAPNSRLAELLEQVRAEFEAQGSRANEYEHQCEYTTSSFVQGEASVPIRGCAPTAVFPFACAPSKCQVLSLSTVCRMTSIDPSLTQEQTHVSVRKEIADMDMYDVVASQLQEMELVRGKVFQLEQTHMSMKQK